MQKHRLLNSLIITITLLALLAISCKNETVITPKIDSRCQVKSIANTISLTNGRVSLLWDLSQNYPRLLVITDHVNQQDIKLKADKAFSIRIQDAIIDLNKFQIANEPKITKDASGIRVTFYLKSEEIPNLSWTFYLKKDANYIRQWVTITADDKDISNFKGIIFGGMMDGPATRHGSVLGSPVVSKHAFFGYEHPMAKSKIKDGRISLFYDRNFPIAVGTNYSSSMVIGFYEFGQLRRAFGNYLEEQRPRKYSTLLNYNSWYDIGYFSKYSEEDCLKRVEQFGEELVRKRNVKVDSLLFDDGWDDYDTLWKFHSGMPNGFSKVTQLCNSYNFAPGVWLSPWGGYGTPREKRIAAGRKEGYELYEDKNDSYNTVFKLSGEKYFKRFSTICEDMVTNYGVNQFKFDGIGTCGTTDSSPEDFEVAIKLMQRLRELNPELYINFTTGTWASPFWTRYADSIWRGGQDHNFIGEGSTRQQWINYRDAMTYKNIVKAGPLYPLNSLMVHGVIYAKHAYGPKVDGKRSDITLAHDPNNDLRDEIRTAFAMGTQLQELYITPELMSEQNWDDLAEAANWARSRADILQDTHWIGGDPAKSEIYGWAAWSKKGSILTLRNPSAKAQTFEIELGELFELPLNARTKYRMISAFKHQVFPELLLYVGEPKTITLEPFQTVTLEER